MGKPERCIGIWGRIFGHWFYKMEDSTGDYCRRCGMPARGWPTA